jgi:hypothetical protein
VKRGTHVLCWVKASYPLLDSGVILRCERQLELDGLQLKCFKKRISTPPTILADRLWAFTLGKLITQTQHPIAA